MTPEELKAKYFKRKKKGTFVECGANDGITESNTKCFEDDGWTGLLIEPNRKIADRCRGNRTSKVERYALVASWYKEYEIKGFFYCTDHAGSLGGYIPENNIHNPPNHFRGKGPVAVPCITLKKLLESHNISGKKIDFMSIDTEGYELNVLDGLDLTINRPKYIRVEDTCKTSTLTEYMKSYRYKLVERVTENDALYKRMWYFKPFHNRKKK